MIDLHMVDWPLILNIAVGMAGGFILVDALQIIAQIVFFILATALFLLRLGVGAIFDAILKHGDK